MTQTQPLSASLEDYLEAIYQVVDEKSAARAKDVAEKLGVAASSVTTALQSLVKRGLINHAPYDLITLTVRGRELAADVVHRHEVLTDFFTKVLSVEEEAAASCACKMEHAVSEDVLHRLVEFIKYEQRCHGGRTKWIEGTGFVRGAADDDATGCERRKTMDSGSETT